MPFGTSIQTYNGAHATHDNGVTNCAVGWSAGKVWIGGDNTGVNYLTRYGIVSGVEEAFATTGSIQSGMAMPAVGLDSDGNLYGTGPNNLGAGGITKVNGPAFTAIASWLYSAPNFGGINIVTRKYGGVQYVLDTNIGNSVINLNNTSLSHDTTYTTSFGWPNGNDKSVICMGAPGSRYGYILSSPNEGFLTQTANLRRVDLPAGTSVIWTYAPGDFLTGATEAFYHSICVDETDGHVMFTVGADDGIIGHYYLVKVDKDTGTIIWKTQLGANAAGEQYGAHQLSHSRIRHQRLALLENSPVRTITVINTATGAIISSQTTGLNGLTIWGQYCYDDGTGVFIGMFDYNIVAGGPAPLNGSTGGFRGWAALYGTSAAPRGHRFLAECGPVRVIDGPAPPYPPLPPPTPPAENYRLTQDANTRVTMSGITRDTLP